MSRSFTVECEVTYRRTWRGVKADSPEEAQELGFHGEADEDPSEECVSGPEYPEDMEIFEEPPKKEGA